MNALAVRLLHMRHDWPVRWAHHPLCQRHAHETWRIGRLHLCKGCVSLAAGLIAGSSAVLAFGGAWCVVALLLLMPITFGLSWPAIYQHLPRWSRNLLRFSAGFSITLAAWTLANHPAIAWPLLPLYAGLWCAFRQSRRRVQASRCNGCPELGRNAICSGYTRHATASRAIETALEARMAIRLFGVDGAMPGKWN